MFYIMKGNLYVAPSGSAARYTPYQQHARIFNTREEAERECCGNERVVRTYGYI